VCIIKMGQLWGDFDPFLSHFLVEWQCQATVNCHKRMVQFVDVHCSLNTPSPCLHSSTFDIIGNASAPTQLAQCRFPGLAISSAQILMYFSKILYGSTLIKQYSETVMVRNYQNADCSLRKKFYCVIYYNFRHTFALYLRLLFVWTSFMDDP